MYMYFCCGRLGWSRLETRVHAPILSVLVIHFKHIVVSCGGPLRFITW